LPKNLVTVESPAKAKTIKRFLGKNYNVKASVGHVRDLPKSKLGIDIENDFEPKYITIRGKGPVVKELKSEAKKSDKIYLATDPDREGEAISWHLAYILGLDEKDPIRIEFSEITKDAVLKAVDKPRPIDRNLVDAQQARRALDRLVGYKISPLLWRKIRKGLSAGRVQSVAVKLICDRENEIEEFIPKEYWSITAYHSKDKVSFESSFYGIRKGKKDEKLELKNKKDVNKVLDSIDKDKFIVDEVKTGKRRRNPYPPYTTSSLQQDASRRLGFSAKKTMAIAQQLYEGIAIKGKGTEGLITYIRTDSTRISNEAIKGARGYIISKYGKDYSNGGRNFSNNSKKETQDAHEGIRPTSIEKAPDDIKASLTLDQYKLYDLIWRRFIASQMSPAVYRTMTVNILSNSYVFRSSGSKIIFDGFMKEYNISDKKDRNLEFPLLEKGEIVKLNKITPKQHFTQPPARYTEASLIKTLEELGIGRPSTYSPTISTILNREYVVLINRSFEPTELGVLVNDLLNEYFDNIINEKFTADMEERLDKVAEGGHYWKDVVKDFYDDFYVVLEKAEKEIEKIEIKEQETDVICEKCGRNMVVKHGRYGKFLACPGYPECKNTKPIVDKINVKCPICNGEVIKRRSKKGRLFYGCSNFPKCNFISWNEPVEEKCPDCGSYMVKKKNKKGTNIICSNKECGYKRVEKEEKS